MRAVEPTRPTSVPMIAERDAGADDAEYEHGDERTELPVGLAELPAGRSGNVQIVASASIFAIRCNEPYRCCIGAARLIAKP